MSGIVNRDAHVRTHTHLLDWCLPFTVAVVVIVAFVDVFLSFFFVVVTVIGFMTPLRLHRYFVGLISLFCFYACEMEFVK